MRLLAVLTLVLLAALPAARGALAEVAEADRRAIQGVIQDQLQAFQADDGNRAFSHASPILQTYFGDPQTFMQMVQSGYDPVYRPREVEFQGLEATDGTLVQKVLFVDRNGKAFLAHYSMQRQEDGSWKINGVWLEALPDVST
jgi:hypothetical protein